MSFHDSCNQSVLAYWYTVPEMAVLSLFDDHVPDREKDEIAAALLGFPQPLAFPPGKPGHPSFEAQISKLTRAKPSLAVFISDRSWLLFSLIDANTDWLHESADTWKDIPAYQDLRDFCRNIEVVNDVAECVVKTRTTLRRQLAVAQDHRNRASTMRKRGMQHM